ncbi:CBS domain-containing protein [Nocardioides montaniterrae]
MTTTVGEAMLHHPTVHPADLSVAAARATFDARTKTHLLLLVEDDVLVTTLTRDDLLAEVDPTSPAARLGTLEGRTVTADRPVEDLRASMAATGLRRAAVVDEDLHLLGLLCLKKTRQGFCTDEGVAAWRADRERS